MDRALQQRLLRALLGKPLVTNAFRGTLVEAILAGVLEPEWTWLADGWGAYDFEGPEGVGLEVKQSAARQDWHSHDSNPSTGRFDIAPRKGRYTGADWHHAPGRHASIYIFAWHPVIDPESADHRDSGQWEFYIVPASRLPVQKSIGLSGIRAMVPPVGIRIVKAEVNTQLKSLS